MIATNARTFIKNRISECLPDYNEWIDYFNTENIPSTVLDGSYHIELGETSSGSFDDTASLEDLSVTVRFFKKGYDTESLQDTFDELYDSVHSFKINAQQPSKRASQNVIKNVFVTSVIPQPLSESNDNVIQIQVDFTLQFYFGIGN